MPLSNPEIKILRDELAKVIADVKKRNSVIEQLADALAEEKRANAEKDMAIDMLERRLRIHENTHSPPSHGSVSAQQKKARSAEKTSHPNKPKERPVGRRAASPATQASPTTEDPVKQYTTGRAGAAGAGAPASRMRAPLPSR